MHENNTGIPAPKRASRRAGHETTSSELRRYKLLIDSVQDYAIFLMDPHGRIMTWNKGAELTKGYKPHEIIGQHFSRFYAAEDIAARKPERELEIASKIGRIEDEDWRIRKDGTRFWANVVITALFEDGKLVGFAKVTRDLTDRKRQEEALKQANSLLKQQQHELQLLNSSKDEFVSLASHQLRTPATAVKLILSSLIDELYGKLDPQHLEVLKKAYDSNERQLNLVESLLKVAQLDAGRVVLRKGLANISEIVRGLIEEHYDSIASRQQTINFASADDIEAEVDKEKLRMALSNIIDNASKYSPEGSIITVTAQKSTGQVRVSVPDEGVGIEPTDLGRIFGKFERLENSRMDTGGSGLGLFWANQVVQLHGGRIDVASRLGQGTTFISFCLWELAMRKILVVEDEPMIREMYELILSNQPYLVEAAENGLIALQKCRQTDFDLILLDLMMPVLGGVGFLHEFLPAAPAHTRIVVLSNLSSGHEYEAAKSLGVSRTALKANISPKELVAIVRYELENT